MSERVSIRSNERKTTFSEGARVGHAEEGWRKVANEEEWTLIGMRSLLILFTTTPLFLKNIHGFRYIYCEYVRMVYMST